MWEWFAFGDVEGLASGEELYLESTRLRLDGCIKPKWMPEPAPVAR